MAVVAFRLPAAGPLAHDHVEKYFCAVSCMLSISVDKHQRLSYKIKNDKIKKTTLKLMEQVRSLKKRLANVAHLQPGSTRSPMLSSPRRKDEDLQAKRDMQKHRAELAKNLNDLSVQNQIKHLQEDLFGKSDVVPRIKRGDLFPQNPISFVSQQSPQAYPRRRPFESPFPGSN